MKTALIDVENGLIGLREEVQVYNVPVETLKKGCRTSKPRLQTSLATELTREEEKALVGQCVKMAEMVSG